LLRIINDVLDFSKIETGRLEMEEIEFSLGALVKKCLGLYQAEAAGKGVALLSDIRAGVPAELEGDPVRLGQILSHLVSNAVKFTAKGQVKLIAEKIEDEEKSVFLRFTVEDTGIGLDQDKIDSLFTAFFQEDSSTTRKFGGTGLGLVISKRLLEMMGGKIWCESRKGAGSRFIFTARFRKPVPAGSQGAIPLSIRQPFLGLSCLAVDDNNMALAILEKALKVLGFAVVKAESGEEAVEYFIRQDPMEHFDLIVVDWKMPGIDGIETVRRISSQTGRLPPVLMLTAFEKDEVSGEVWEAGIKSVLTKPISLISLNESLTALLGAEETVPPEASRLQPEGGPEPEMDLKIRGANVLLAVKGRERVLNYSRLLTQAAVRFKIVDTGQEAVDAVQSDRYDLVFMDEQLPEMDGLTAAAVIRSFGQFRDLSIAGLAGDDQESSRQRCLDAGMNYCLPQSAGPAEFFKILSQLINPLDPAGTNHLR
jgi:CheY-like chemotaxis protein